MTYVDIHLEKLKEYISGITGNTIPAGKLEVLAVQRFIAFKQKYDYREQELRRILKFFSLLNITFKNEIRTIELSPWQVFLIANCYALYYRGSDERLIKEAVISTGGKNGKSSLIVTLGLLEAVVDNELNAAVAIISPTNKQSGLILKYCKEIIDNSPAIKNLFKVKHSTIENKQKGSVNTLMILTNETDKVQGVNLSCSILDEIFLYDNLDIRYIAKRKGAARKNPIQYSIGTVSSKDMKGYDELYLPCRKVLEGEAEDDELFIYIFQQDDESELLRPDLWRKSNPSISLLGTHNDLVKEYNRIKVFPSNLSSFKTESLNFWKEAGQEAPFIEREVLNNSMRENKTIPLNAPVWIGVDLSTNLDLSSIAVLAVVDDVVMTKTINIMPNSERHFIKGNEIDLNRFFVKDVADFALNNYNYSGDPFQCVIRCQTPVLDENLIEEIIIDLSNKYQIQGVYYDRYNSKQMMTKLENRGLHCVPIAQNITTLSQPLKWMEKKLILGEFLIEKNLVTKWQANNINLYTSFKGDIQLQKNKQKYSIDAWIAMNIAAAGYWIDNFDELKNVLNRFV